MNDLEIVLQVTKHAINMASATAIAAQARNYAGLVQYILIDPSGGIGESFDPARTYPLLDALSTAVPDAVLAVAGGIGPDNVHHIIKRARANYPHQLCIDAQGRLRSDDKLKLDLPKAREYIRKAAEAFAPADSEAV